MYRISSARQSRVQFYSNKRVQWSDEKINVLGIWICQSELETLRCNYEPLFDKVENIFKMWQQRDLSLIGKILIVNTLITSLLVYKMAVLPMLSDSYCKRLMEQITKFIWNQKKAKISIKILQGNKSDGGLALVNLQKKDMAIKISWLPRILMNKQINELPNNALGYDASTLIWQANISTDDINPYPVSHFVNIISSSDTCFTIT